MKVLPAVDASREKGAVVFDLLETFLRESGGQVVRLTENFETHPIWRAGLGAALEDLIRETAMVTDNIGLIRGRLEAQEKRDEALAALVSELRGQEPARSVAEAWHGALFTGKDAVRGRWVESRGGRECGVSGCRSIRSSSRRYFDSANDGRHVQH